MAYEGRDLTPMFTELTTRAAANPFDAAALFDLSILLQATGARDKALEIQALALAASRPLHPPAITEAMVSAFS